MDEQPLISRFPHNHTALDSHMLYLKELLSVVWCYAAYFYAEFRQVGVYPFTVILLFLYTAQNGVFL